MASIIRMPEVLAGALEAAIQTWLIAEGETVVVGQPLAEIETDKAVAEFPSDFEGTVAKMLVQEGDNVAVGAPILAVKAPGDDDAAVDAALAAEGVGPSADSAHATQEQPAPVAEAEPAEAPAESTGSDTVAEGRRLFVSPLVRRLAAENGVDVTAIEGSGPNGRIVRRDLERFLAEESEDSGAAKSTTVPVSVNASATAPQASTGYEDIPLDRMRKAIARRLTESKSTVPHFYLVAHCRVDALLALRAQVNASADRKISVNDFIVKAVGASLAEVPEANAAWNEDSIRRFQSADISVAVATEGGLITPVVRSVDKLALSEVSATIADLATRAKEGRLKQNEIEGGSFSVSNLGMYGTDEFSAILNPPQSGILAIGAAAKQPVVSEDGELEVGTVMTVTLSADHRVLDGALAATWLSAFQRRIENPLTILV